MMIQMAACTSKRKCYFLKYKYIFFLIFWNHPPHFNTAFMGKSVWTNVAGLGTTYDVTSWDDNIGTILISLRINEFFSLLVIGSACLLWRDAHSLLNYVSISFTQQFVFQSRNFFLEGR